MLSTLFEAAKTYFIDLKKRTGSLSYYERTDGMETDGMEIIYSLCAHNG